MWTSSGGGGFDGLGDLLDAHPFGDLVEHPELAAVGGVFARELDAAHGVADVDHAAGLPAAAVDGQRVPDHGLDHEPVQNRAEHRVAVKPGGEALVAGVLIVLLPGFGSGVGLLLATGRVAMPGVPGCAPAPTAEGWSSFRVSGVVRAAQAGAGRAHSRCQQVRNASFQGQSGLIFRTRSRPWRASRAGMCQIR